MARQNANAGGNAQPSPADYYETFLEKGQVHPAYREALKPAKEKRDIGLLQKLAPLTFKDDKEMMVEMAYLSKTDNLEHLSQAAEVGHNRNKKQLEEIGDAHLKDIIEKRVSKKNLDYMLMEVELKDSTEVQTHNEVIPIHKSYQKMFKNLAYSQSDDIDRKKKDDALNEIKEKVVGFYESKYGDDNEIMDLLKTLSEVDDVRLTRYQKFAVEKKKQFDDKTKDNLHNYLKAAVKDRADCYALLAAQLKQRE